VAEGRQRDDHQAREVDRPLPETTDERTAGRREDEPEEGERRDDDRGCGHPDVEAAAYAGSTGVMSPKPRAIAKAAPTSTQTCFGMGGRSTTAAVPSLTRSL
jgi:hypothetical protein